VISVSHSVYTCNSIVAAALLIVLERRLGNFLLFLSFFLPFICSPLHQSCTDHGEGDVAG
jgi:hypothetical protein